MSMPTDPAAMASIDQAVDALIIETSRLNDVLLARGWQPIMMPTRHNPIEPFFHDLTELVKRLSTMVDES